MLAFITAPPEHDTRQLTGSLGSLGVKTVLAKSSTDLARAATARGADPVDALCEALDARVATIAACDLLVAVLDGTHPDVLVDIGIAYARGTDCYALQTHGEPLEALHTDMLDGHARTTPALLTRLRQHLRLPMADSNPLTPVDDAMTR
ncbi:hypothetical protein POF50_001290 [Streptomyces sp. SL13]|uniref:Nucleoside 2-deoxyribosyltransferase n=1 Tax=Streptantibioticus silvisoli TaxID=2705255 RepID=A0AA90H0R1_9ACTN|nr:hypothetical protein [Streptantibioticus silvisoli]MDI5967997.1 hypothetical protein [Streptantibioticus silvisoli]